jgi:hypothetical protein
MSAVGKRLRPRGASARRNKQPYRIRLPGFIAEENVGLGDALKRFSSAFGIRPCSPCARRAAMLNRWMVFTGRRSE